MGVCNTKIACFAAIRTVVFSVGAETDSFESLAITTIAVAFAIFLRFVALRAQECGSHVFFSLTRSPGRAHYPQPPNMKRNPAATHPITIGHVRESEQVA